jgi:hypothetical protein
VVLLSYLMVAQWAWTIVMVQGAMMPIVRTEGRVWI